MSHSWPSSVPNPGQVCNKVIVAKHRISAGGAKSPVPTFSQHAIIHISLRSLLNQAVLMFYRESVKSNLFCFCLLQAKKLPQIHCVHCVHSSVLTNTVVQVYSYSGVVGIRQREIQPRKAQCWVNTLKNVIVLRWLVHAGCINKRAGGELPYLI